MPTEKTTLTPPIRLTRHGTKPSGARMERFLRANGITGTRFKEWAGCGVRDWMKLNPTWTQRAFEVLVMENLEMLVQKPRADVRGKQKREASL